MATALAQGRCDSTARRGGGGVKAAAQRDWRPIGEDDLAVQITRHVSNALAVMTDAQEACGSTAKATAQNAVAYNLPLTRTAMRWLVYQTALPLRSKTHRAIRPARKKGRLCVDGRER
jgi:hypothetical protein